MENIYIFLKSHDKHSKDKNNNIRNIKKVCLTAFTLYSSWHPQQTHLDSEAEDLDAHPAHVGSCHLPYQLGKLVPVLVDLLHCQCACGEGRAAEPVSVSTTLDIDPLHLLTTLLKLSHMVVK